MLHTMRRQGVWFVCSPFVDDSTPFTLTCDKHNIQDLIFNYRDVLS